MNNFRSGIFLFFVLIASIKSVGQSPTLEQNVQTLIDSGHQYRVIKLIDSLYDSRSEIIDFESADDIYLAIQHLNIEYLKGNHQFVIEQVPIIRNKIQTSSKSRNEHFAKLYNVLGSSTWYLEGVDKAKHHYLKALQYFELDTTQRFRNVAEIYLNMAYVYMEQNKYDSLKYCINRSRSYITNIMGKNHYKLADTRNVMGSYWNKLGRYDHAIEEFEKGVHVLRYSIKDKFHRSFWAFYGNLGHCYKNIGNFKRSIEYYRLAEEILVQTDPNLASNFSYQLLLQSLASVHYRSGEYEEAQKYIEKQNYNVIRSNPDIVYEYYEMLIANEIAREKYNTALEHVQALKRFCQGSLMKKCENISYWELNCLVNLKKNESAKILFTEIYKQDSLSAERDMELCYYRAVMHQHNFDSIITYSNSIDSFIQQQKVNHESRYIYTYEDYYWNLAEIWKKRHNNNPELTSYEKAMYYYKKYIEWQTERLNFQGIRNEQIQFCKNIKRAIDHRIDLYINSKSFINDNHKADSLINLFEQGRSILSRQIELVSNEDSGGDDKRALFNFYKKKIDLEKDTSIELKLNVLELTRELEIEDDFSHLQRDRQLPEIDPDESILYFHFLEDSVLLLLINKSSNQLITIDRKLVDKKILRQLSLTKNKDSKMDSMKRSSLDLYKLFLSDVQLDLRSKVVIIPDNVLNYLPFELLQDSLGRYFIEDHTISYQYSMDTWVYLVRNKNNPSKELLAVAPDFPPRPVNWAEIDSINQLIASRGDLYKLAYTNDEINSISNYWSTQFMTGHLATVQNFIQDASDYRIVHLASHGKADDRVGDYCYLAFTETSDTLDRKLYVRDLYNMKLNAEMVVLSACETGMGELQQGEGILSLARGFVYAGAKSIISSLWSVNDQSTKDIMSAFYKNLKEGQSKDEALRNAKLDFIEENPNAHPYYWAAFTAVGDMSPIESGWPWWVWGIGVVLLILFIYFLRRMV